MDVQDLLGNVAQHLSVSRAFGTAYEKEGTLVIPVAMVIGGGGGGDGTARSADDPSNGVLSPGGGDESDYESGTSSGSGGGFGGVVIPVGVYFVRDDQVRWVPAVNANLSIIAGLAAFRMILRALRRAHRRAN